MKNIEIIKKLKKSTFTNEDGENYTLDFQDGLTDSEIEKLAQSFPSKIIDSEIKEILKETRGWSGYGMEQVDFSSIGQFGLNEISPNSISLGNDGWGNYWILDILNDGSLGNVFYACHDPFVLIKYSDNLNEFLNTLIEFYESPSENYLNEIYNNVVFEIWENDGKITEKEDFIRENIEYSDFLSEFNGNDWVIADLRYAKNKDGFAWGKFGPNNLTKRHPKELIWVIKKKKKGFWERIFRN